MRTARWIAARLLMRAADEGAYSNAAARSELSKGELSAQDTAFASALFYGTLERLITLDAYLAKFCTIPLPKLDREVLAVLRTGVYQILYMDTVPDSAAVDESVKTVREMKKSSAAGLVNAVLRKVASNKEINALLGLKGSKRLSVFYSCPEWLINMLLLDYGKESAVQFLENSLGNPPLFIRVNTVKNSPLALKEKLEKSGISCEETAVENCLLLHGLTSIEQREEYRQGLFYVQDMSSQICAGVLNAKPGETVLDLCAAPGGKSFTIAQYMKNEGKLCSFDLSGNKLAKISEGAKRLNIDVIQTAENDAKAFHSDIPMADRVLCDVPCSGLGVIRRRPEIKYKPKASFMGLPEVQYQILQTSSRYVKAGGILIYSTCTVSKAENEGVAERFLQEHPGFRADPFSFGPVEASKGFITLFPGKESGDGFFICRMRRVE